ncbi:uncharacterized protein LOC119440260 [Dermacentor silvarum]|uniref:uncharacterized protein LOC119440260 n=1 Tax=Dermacentor silvarum TaxID=543639 RepID=UPI00189ADEB8|nr:uncharacterized protein LOC119440260 [Dermacentor silvarum]
MATTLGKLPEFCPDTGNIDVYLERFELFAKANEIDAGKKLEVFLTVLREKAFVTLRSLLLPKRPTEVKYEDATKVLQQHYAPKRSVVTERYHFYRRNQESSETIAQFLVELKRLAATCSFGTFLQEALRDRLIAGLRSDNIQCRLLALPDDEVTWDRVCKVSTVMEAAQKDTQDMLVDNAGASNADVHSQWPPVKPHKQQPTRQRPSSYELTPISKSHCEPIHRGGSLFLAIPEDIFASLVGGTMFTVLDLTKAYLQLELDEHAEELLKVNMHTGLFRYWRLPYGVARAPAMFQAVMDQVLQGIPGTARYLDDVLIAGKNLAECYGRTEQVLKALSKHGIRCTTCHGDTSNATSIDILTNHCSNDD